MQKTSKIRKLYALIRLSDVKVFSKTDGRTLWLIEVLYINQKESYSKKMLLTKEMRK